MSPTEKTEKLLEFYAPEHRDAIVAGKTFTVTEEMQAHAEACGYDRTKDNAPAADKATRRKG
jgi:hypothetical protein